MREVDVGPILDRSLVERVHRGGAVHRRPFPDAPDLFFELLRQVVVFGLHGSPLLPLERGQSSPDGTDAIESMLEPLGFVVVFVGDGDLLEPGERSSVRVECGLPRSVAPLQPLNFGERCRVQVLSDSRVRRRHRVFFSAASTSSTAVRFLSRRRVFDVHPQNVQSDDADLQGERRPPSSTGCIDRLGGPR